MRKKKVSKSRDVAKRKNTAAAKRGGSFREQMAKMAESSKATRAAGGARNTISTQGGKFSYKGMPLEAPMMAIVVHQAAENTYYDTPYDQDNPHPPACFAVSLYEDELKSHADSPSAQGDECALCELNQWGTAERGKGKACGNRQRLILISADVEELTAEYIEKAEMAVLGLSPTAIGGWGTYEQKIKKGFNTIAAGVVTAFDLENDGKSAGHKVVASLDEVIESEEILEAIMSRRAEAEEMALQTFDTSGYDEEPAPKPRKKKSKKKSKKTTRRSRRG